MRKRILRRSGIAALAVVGITLAGCTTGSGESADSAAADGGIAEMEPVVLTYSDSNVDTAAHVIAMQTFMDTVTEKTDGKITFDTYYAAALHPVTEALSAIDTGLTDITFVSPSNVPDSVPVATWEATVAQGEIPLEFPLSLTAGTPVQMAASQDGSPLAEELASFDAETLVTWGTAPNSIMCKPEITDAADAQGQLIRSPGPPFTYEVEALGMTNVTLPVTDVFEGLQRGVIGCFMNVISPFITLGIWDEAKYFVPATFGSSLGSQLLISKSTLESLPIEAQQVIFDASVDLLGDIIEATVARNAQWAAEAPGKGVEFVDPTSFNTVIDKARSTYIADALANPPAGVTDPEGFQSQLGTLVQDWDQVASELQIESGSPTTQEGWVELYSSVEDIDWDAYKAALHEFLDQYRP